MRPDDVCPTHPADPHGCEVRGSATESSA
jgi:hypothetical protein